MLTDEQFKWHLDAMVHGAKQSGIDAATGFDDDGFLSEKIAESKAILL